MHKWCWKRAAALSASRWQSNMADVEISVKLKAADSEGRELSHSCDPQSRRDGFPSQGRIYPQHWCPHAQRLRLTGKTRHAAAPRAKGLGLQKATWQRNGGDGSSFHERGWDTGPVVFGDTTVTEVLRG